MIDAPDSLKEVQSHVTRALKLLAKLTPGYDEAAAYYDGSAAEKALGDAAQTIIDQSKQTPISLAHIPVDVVADKVDLSAITASDSSAAKILSTWFENNEIDDEGDDWIRKACYLGDFYAITDPVFEIAAGGKVTADPEAIRTLASDPRSTIVVYDRKTERDAEYGLHYWPAGTSDTPLIRVAVYYANATIRLVYSGKQLPDDGDEFFPDAEMQDLEKATIPHTGSRGLIAHLPIGGRPYGIPLHKKAYGPQDAITKISANNLVNVEAQGLPSRWALIDPVAEIDDEIDDDFGTRGPTTADGDDSDDGMTTATRGVHTRTMPGAVTMLRGVKSVGTFDSGNPEGFLKNLDWYVRVMAVITGTALFEFDLNGEQPSGEARRRAEGRANRKAAKVKRWAGAFFEEIARQVLALTDAADDGVQATFNPSETSTDKDGLELVSMKIKAGVPVRQALLEAGYTETQVEEWYPDDAPEITPEVLQILAPALASLGNAKTLGVISDAAVTAMLPKILTAAAGAEADPVAEAQAVKAQADAVGALVRAGADPEEAAARVGLGGITFPNAPVTIRLPEQQAATLEGAAPAPSAPGA